MRRESVADSPPSVFMGTQPGATQRRPSAGPVLMSTHVQQPTSLSPSHAHA